MRIGYAIASPKLIRYLNDVKYSFNSYTLNRASLVCGAESVKDREYFEKTVAEIVRDKGENKRETGLQQLLLF